MSDGHEHYDQLTEDERQFVDHILQYSIQDGQYFSPRIPLAVDDRSERAADAIARWVIESRETK